MNNSYDLELPDECPLDGSTLGNLEAYRIVKTNPPSAEDLLTYKELESLPKANACKRVAISIFTSYDKAKHRLDLSPHLGADVAVIKLTPVHGPVSLSNHESGHMSWWPYQGMRKPEEFLVVKS